MRSMRLTLLACYAKIILSVFFVFLIPALIFGVSFFLTKNVEKSLKIGLFSMTIIAVIKFLLWSLTFLATFSSFPPLRFPTGPNIGVFTVRVGFVVASFKKSIFAGITVIGCFILCCHLVWFRGNNTLLVIGVIIVVCGLITECIISCTDNFLLHYSLSPAMFGSVI